MPAYFDTGFTVRKPAWHGLGVVLDDFPRTIAEAREYAGLQWEPEIVPVYQRHEELVGMNFDGSVEVEESFVEVPNARLVQRSDNKDVIGHGISDRYVPISNSQMFEVLESLVDQGLKIETAGSIKGGSHVWALAYLDRPYTLPGDDSVSFPYLAVVNSHDGKAAMRAMPTQVRIVCWNTYQAAMMESQRSNLFYDFRHKGTVSERIDEAKKAIGGMRNDTERWFALATHLFARQITEAHTELFIKEFIPAPPAGLITDRVYDNIERDRATFRTLLNGPQNEANAGTALSLVNTAVEYLDHARGYRNTDTYLGRTILKPEPMKAKAVKLVNDVLASF